MFYWLDVNVIQPSGGNSINWVSLLATIGSILVGISAIVFNFFSTKKTNATSQINIEKTLEQNKENINRTLLSNTEINKQNLKARQNEERKDEIYKILNDLYGPLFQLRQKSNLVYQKFIHNKSPNADDGRFSTLLYLLDKGGPNDLSPNDKILVAEIIKIGQLCEELIQGKAGLIDDEDLRKKWFPDATKHYLIIRLAYNGSLKGETELYKDSMFPVEIDNLIEKRIQLLQQELKRLE